MRGEIRMSKVVDLKESVEKRKKKKYNYKHCCKYAPIIKKRLEDIEFWINVIMELLGKEKNEEEMNKAIVAVLKKYQEIHQRQVEEALKEETNAKEEESKGEDK